MDTSRRSFLCAVATAGSILGARAAFAQRHQMGMQMDMPVTMPKGKGVLVFAAATLRPVLDDLVKRYKASGGGAIVVAYGPSPTFAKQIVNGAPADLFISADVVWMDYVADRKLLQPDTRVDLVRNRLVLVGSGGEKTDRASVIGPAFQIAPIVGSGRLAMCNPADHPAGRYGKASLEKLGLWSSISGKIAIVENPQVAVAMVARGDVPAAVVFATDALGVAGVRVLGTFPDASHPPIVYPAAVATTGRYPSAAKTFLEYLRSSDARRVFDRYGYR